MGERSFSNTEEMCHVESKACQKYLNFNLQVSNARARIIGKMSAIKSILIMNKVVGVACP